MSSSRDTCSGLADLLHLLGCAFVCDERFLISRGIRSDKLMSLLGMLGLQCVVDDRDVDMTDRRSNLLHVICGDDGDMPRSKKQEARNRKAIIS